MRSERGTGKGHGKDEKHVSPCCMPHSWLHSSSTHCPMGVAGTMSAYNDLCALCGVQAQEACTPTPPLLTCSSVEHTAMLWTPSAGNGAAPVQGVVQVQVSVQPPTPHLLVRRAHCNAVDALSKGWRSACARGVAGASVCTRASARGRRARAKIAAASAHSCWHVRPKLR